MKVKFSIKLITLMALSLFLMNCASTPKERIVPVTLVDIQQESVEQKKAESNGNIRTEPIKLEYKEVTTWAYLEVIEKSPNIKGVSRLTNNENEEVFFGFTDYSPVDDFITYSLTELAKDTEEDPNSLNMKYISNIWKQRIGSFAKTRLTNGNRIDIDPSFTRNGEQIVFSSDRSGRNRNIWMLNVAGGGGLRLVTGSTSEDYSTFVSRAEGLTTYTSLPENSIEPQIWTIDLEGRIATQLREGKDSRISPNGDELIFLKHKIGGQCDEGEEQEKSTIFQIWKMTIEGASVTQLSTNEDFCVRDPMWSPNGKWIVYSSNENIDYNKHRNYDIWLMAADGTRRMQLTTNGSMDILPLFDRTGEHILFVSNRGGFWNIWRFTPVIY